MRKRTLVTILIGLALAMPIQLKKQSRSYNQSRERTSLINTLDKNQPDIQKLNSFLENKGKDLLDYYKKSKIYPSGCIAISTPAYFLLEEAGIKTKLVLGHHKGDHLNQNKSHFHTFNIVKLGDEEYVLDLTKDQYTLPTRKITSNGITHLHFYDPERGESLIPYLMPLKNAKEYAILKEINPEKKLKQNSMASTILKKIQGNTQ